MPYLHRMRLVIAGGDEEKEEADHCHNEEERIANQIMIWMDLNIYLDGFKYLFGWI